MQEILELKEKMKTLQDNLTFANVELDAETVAWKKFVKTFYVDAIFLTQVYEPILSLRHW